MDYGVDNVTRHNVGNDVLPKNNVKVINFTNLTIRSNKNLLLYSTANYYKWNSGKNIITYHITQ